MGGRQFPKPVPKKPSGMASVPKENVAIPIPATPENATWADRFKHSGWRWTVSVLAFAGATLTPELIRIGCLAIGVIAAAKAYHHDFARRSWKKTAGAFVALAVLAVGLFVGARFFDHLHERGEHIASTEAGNSPKGDTNQAASTPTQLPSAHIADSTKQLAAIPPRKRTPVKHNTGTTACPYGGAICVNGKVSGLHFENSSIHDNASGITITKSGQIDGLHLKDSKMYNNGPTAEINSGKRESAEQPKPPSPQ